LAAPGARLMKWWNWATRGRSRTGRAAVSISAAWRAAARSTSGSTLARSSASDARRINGQRL